jgi:SAM-dependent methyltransferase
MDPYQNPDQQNDTTIQAMVARLEERGQHPFFLRLVANYADQVRADTPLRVLDLGCGTGVVIRHFEKRLHPESTLIGADISRRLLDAADAHSPGSRIHWEKLEPGPLPYNAASFDLVVMHTLLSHVAESGALLAEAHRILKPDGTLIVFDADHASTTYGLPDRVKTRETDQKLVATIATHPDICRQLPALLQNAGFELKRHTAEILSECGRGDFWLSSVKGFARLIPALGILPDEEGRAWVESMLASHEAGTFFAAGSYYTFFASKR